MRMVGRLKQNEIKSGLNLITLKQGIGLQMKTDENQVNRGLDNQTRVADSRPRNGSPEFYRLIDEAAITHDKKSHDYASNSNPFGNYIFAGEMALLFKHSAQDAGFVGRLAEKIYRIANLESSEKTAINETIDDTERDICVITLLWMACRREKRKALPSGNAEQRALQRIHEAEVFLSDSSRKQVIAYFERILEQPYVSSTRERNIEVEQSKKV